MSRERDTRNMALHDGFTGNNFNLCDCGSGLFTPDNGKYQIARVKFGVPLEEVFKNDIPGPLLVLILKLNKQAPYKKDIFRAPGHHGNVKKLIHFLQNGRLVNIDNFSVYTIASVIKKFLRKVPDGIFGKQGEQQLFKMIEMEGMEDRREEIQSLISSLPLTTQRLIVLLFGTFRIVATNAERSETGMTAEALGVSVAPSFFQSCVSDGGTAKMEDVLRYKVATKIMKFLIENFGVSNLYGRDNYEYYARITGRILKVDEDWIVSFRTPPDSFASPMTQHDDCHSTPELMRASTDTEGIEDFDCSEPSASLTIIPENNRLGSYTRLSISLEDAEVFKVYERQVARMKTRSDWFLSPSSTNAKSALVAVDVSSSSNQIFTPREEPSGNRPPGGLFIAKADTLKQLVRRGSFEEKQRRLVRRTSSKKKNKENGTSSTTTNTKTLAMAPPNTSSTPASNTWTTFTQLPSTGNETGLIVTNVDPRLQQDPFTVHDYDCSTMSLCPSNSEGTEDPPYPVCFPVEIGTVDQTQRDTEVFKGNTTEAFQVSLTYKPRI